MDTFALGIHRKMTAHRDIVLGGVNTMGQGVSISNPAINKFGHSADFAARKGQISSRVAENGENQDLQGDDAMSVDGDISYCSNEMDELGEKSI